MASTTAGRRVRCWRAGSCASFSLRGLLGHFAVPRKLQRVQGSRLECLWHAVRHCTCLLPLPSAAHVLFFDLDGKMDIVRLLEVSSAKL